jgi:hypothetical protein
VELAEYFNRLAQIGVEEILITPLGAERSLDSFLDRFVREVQPHLR